MNMTHYMELLASNQPWNLLIFMALPVVLAETVAITELYILYTRKFDTWVRQLNRIAGILVGLTFVGIISYLLVNAVIPITRAGEWRTIIDLVAVLTYLIGGIPMILIALQDLGLIYKADSEERRLARHATYVAIFSYGPFCQLGQPTSSRHCDKHFPMVSNRLVTRRSGWNVDDGSYSYPRVGYRRSSFRRRAFSLLDRGSSMTPTKKYREFPSSRLASRYHSF